MAEKWFDVNKEGLAKLLNKRGKSFVLFELIQNAWDQQITQVDVNVEMIKNRRAAKITVIDDDPQGFIDITHAFTLFAESVKKKDPTKRGRFNIGEKLVLALCESAIVHTTTGGVKFEANGTRKNIRKKRNKGSEFSAIIKVTKDEFKEMIESIDSLLPPSNVKTVFNGEPLRIKEPVKSFTASLPTEISDEVGNLKRTIRKTKVDIHIPDKNEKGYIYEMGIPVVETGDKFHVNVHQKVLLNMDRDNVTPAYLRKIRTFVFNNTYDIVEENDINESWVKDALSDPDCENEAIKKSLDLRYGKKRVIFDPSDPESNKKAVSQGYTVIPGKSLSKNEWDNVKKAGAAKPAGQVTPSDKILSSPDGIPPLDWSKLTSKQKKFVNFIEQYAKRLTDRNIRVEIIKINNNYSAWYNNGVLTFNYNALGKRFFEDFPENLKEVIDITIHELGHEYSSDHLSKSYYKALTRLGAKSTLLAIDDPNFFQN